MTRKISDPAPTDSRLTLRKLAKQDQLIAQLRRRIDLLELEKEALLKRNRRLHHKLAEVEHENAQLQHEALTHLNEFYALRREVDALTAADRYAENEARQREASLYISLSTDAIVRQSEPDPLDEDAAEPEDYDGS